MCRFAAVRAPGRAVPKIPRRGADAPDFAVLIREAVGEQEAVVCGRPHRYAHTPTAR